VKVLNIDPTARSPEPEGALQEKSGHGGQKRVGIRDSGCELADTLHSTTAALSSGRAFWAGETAMTFRTAAALRLASVSAPPVMSRSRACSRRRSRRMR